ncbi:MAG: WecB/TagA/CpsF family glycosyltransferase [Candidatus Promineifilaceae bacterium]
MDRLEDFVEVGRATGKNHQVATVNADFVVKAMSDPELRFLLQESDLLMADGMPLVWGARFLGLPLEERVAGSDIVPMLAERAAKKGYSIYMLGAAPGIAQQAAVVLQEKLPNLVIAGINSPPYSSVLEMSDEIVQDIRQANPDILLVAFGNPKQEKWIGMYRHQVNVPVMIGVGATLDFIAGYRARAPLWMQKSGLEWLFRLAQEPRRLWRRYVLDLVNFGYFFTRQWWTMRRGDQPAMVLPKANSMIVDNEAAVLELQGKITVQNHEEIYHTGQEALAEVPYLVVNMENVAFLDSTAVGSLVALAKDARNQKGEMFLAHVPENIKRTLDVLKLASFFVIVPTIETAFAALREEKVRIPETAAPSVPTRPQAVSPAQWTVVKVTRRLDANTANDLIEQCEEHLWKNPFLILDFAATVFLASAGLAALAKIQRLAEEQNGKVRLANCSEDVNRVIEIVRFDKVLSLYKDIDSAMGMLESA